MPTSKLNLGENLPTKEQNGISNGVCSSSRSEDVTRNHDQAPERQNSTKFMDTPQKFYPSNLDKFAQDALDDSGVASGSSILSASSSETLDSKVADASTDSAVNGSFERYSATYSPVPTKRPIGIVSNGANATSSRRSPDLRVRFSDSDTSDTASNIPSASDTDTKVPSNDSPTEGATGVNPTLWLGDDQMLLLPGHSTSEETDSNSGTSEAKSFEGLLSPNGTSILWDEDTDWILLFDNMIRYADRKQHRTTRSCGCKGWLQTREIREKLDSFTNLEKSGKFEKIP